MLIAASAMMTSASTAVISLVRSGVRSDSRVSRSQMAICESSGTLLDKA